MTRRGRADRGAGVVALVVALLLSWDPAANPADQVIGPDFNLLDGSWSAQLAAAPLQGQRLGRDFVFTYGPLYHLVHGLGFIVGGDAASVLRLQRVGDLWGGAVALWLLALLVSRRGGTCLGVVAGWLVFFGAAPLRPIVGLAVAAIPFAGRWQSRGGALLSAAASTMLVLLYAVDVGALVGFTIVGSALVTVAATLGLDAPTARGLRRLAVLAVAGVVAGVVVVAFVPPPGVDRAWLPHTADLARGYADKLAYRLDPDAAGTLAVFGVLLAGAVLGLARQIRADARADAKDSRALAMLATGVFALGWLRVGLTRSDAGHVELALLPAWLYLGFLCPAFVVARVGRSGTASVIATVLVVLVAGPATIADAVAAVPTRLIAFSRIERMPARLVVDNATVAEAVDVVTRARLRSLYVWPHQAVVHVAAGTRNLSRVVQSYAATTDALEAAEIASLETHPDAPVLVLRDSGKIDGVLHQTRTPTLFRYLLENYTLDGAPGAHVALLRRTSRVRSTLEPLHLRATFTGSTVLRLPAGCCRLGDTWWLDVRAEPTASLGGLRKTGRLVVGLVIDDGKVFHARVPLVQDGRSHPALVTLWDARDPLFLGQFAARSWQASDRVVALEIAWQPIDALSASPERIELESAAVFRRTGDFIEQQEGPWVGHQDAAVTAWLYGSSEDVTK